MPMTSNLEPLFEYLNRYVFLDERECVEIERLAKRTKYKKDDYFLKEGQTADSVAFIIKGGVRMYYLSSEGKNHMKAFNFTGSFFAGYTSLLTNKPSNHYIQFLTETELLVFNYAGLKQSSSFDKFQQIERQIIQNEYMEKEHREYTFLTMSASDRYLDFLRNYEEHLEILVDKDISSFLGMEPSSLSRIKKKSATSHF